ncbi:MAG: hypothetical protein U0516_00255 [Candidatus Saccharibacteria bacterium]
MMKNRTILFVVIAVLGILVFGITITFILSLQSLPLLKPELVAQNAGILSVVNDEPFLINSNKLYKIEASQLTLKKEFANDSQLELNPFGKYITEKRPNLKTVYTIDNFQSIQQNTGRFFAWLTSDSYLITNATNSTEGTDAGELTETAFEGTVLNSQKKNLFTSNFIIYMLLAHDSYIDIAQIDEEDNYDNLIVNQFTYKDGLQKISNKRNFGYKPFIKFGFSLIQENTASRDIFLLKDKQLNQLKISNSVNIQAVSAINNSTLIYFDKDSKEDKIFLYTYNINNQESKKIAKLPVEFTQITSLAVNSQYIYINCKQGIYKISIKDING